MILFYIRYNGRYKYNAARYAVQSLRDSQYEFLCIISLFGGLMLVTNIYIYFVGARRQNVNCLAPEEFTPAYGTTKRHLSR